MPISVARGVVATAIPRQSVTHIVDFQSLEFVPRQNQTNHLDSSLPLLELQVVVHQVVLLLQLVRLHAAK